MHLLNGFGRSKKAINCALCCYKHNKFFGLYFNEFKDFHKNDAVKANSINTALVILFTIDQCYVPANPEVDRKPLSYITYNNQ